MIHHPREVDRDLADVDAEPMPVAGAGGDACGGQECLGRDAPGPQAVTTGALAFHEEDPGTQTCGGLGTHDPGRPAPDDQKVPGLVWRAD